MHIYVHHSKLFAIPVKNLKCKRLKLAVDACSECIMNGIWSFAYIRNCFFIFILMSVFRFRKKGGPDFLQPKYTRITTILSYFYLRRVRVRVRVGNSMRLALRISSNQHINYTIFCQPQDVCHTVMAITTKNTRIRDGYRWIWHEKITAKFMSSASLQICYIQVLQHLQLTISYL